MITVIKKKGGISMENNEKLETKKQMCFPSLITFIKMCFLSFIIFVALFLITWMIELLLTGWLSIIIEQIERI